MADNEKMEEQRELSSETVVQKREAIKSSPMQMEESTKPQRSKRGHPLGHALKDAVKGQGSPTDLTVRLSDGAFECHKVVLAAVSGLLADMLSDSDCDSVVLSDFSTSEFKTFLDLIYTGKVLADEDTVARLNVLVTCLKLHPFSVRRDALPKRQEQPVETSIPVHNPQPTFEDNFDLLKESLLTIGLLAEDTESATKEAQPPNANEKDFVEVPIYFPPSHVESFASPAQSDESNSSFTGAASDLGSESNDLEREQQPIGHQSIINNNFLEAALTRKQEATNPSLPPPPPPQPSQPTIEIDRVRKVTNLPSGRTLDWQDNFKRSEEFIYKICYICDQVFLGLHPLLRHLRSAHAANGDHSISCRVCSALQISGTALHEHMRLHFKSEITEDGREVNKCHEPGCDGVEFGTRHALMRHRLKAHPKKGRVKDDHKCEDCGGRVFSSVKAFSIHMMTKHKKRPFACEFCDQRFTLLVS